MQPSLQAPVSVNVTSALPSSALCSITAVSACPQQHGSLVDRNRRVGS